MKKLFCLLAIAALVGSTVGCANGPIRNFLRGDRCSTCQPPLAPASCGCANDGAGLASQSVSNQGASYMNDSYIQGDPYINNSNIGGATINPPVFDSYGGTSFGGTTAPPGSSGTLPVPNGGF